MRKGQLPKRPFRDSAILYAVFAVAGLAIILVTGGNVLVGIPVVVGCFVLATAYSWWQIRKRLEAEAEEERS